jgi:hypothetical protein
MEILWKYYGNIMRKVEYVVGNKCTCTIAILVGNLWKSSFAVENLAHQCFSTVFITSQQHHHKFHVIAAAATLSFALMP